MIALISATEDEVSGLTNSLTNKKISNSGTIKFIEGKFLDIDVVVSISGVGLKKARNCTNTLIKKYNPGTIISAGFAGALNPKLVLGEIVVPDWVSSLKNQEKIQLDNNLPYIASKYIIGGVLTESSFINVKEKRSFISPLDTIKGYTSLN